jgi:glycosyltransferase involved in cell wall biosynthesis
MPLFSIVMPTRNRGHLLGYALRSALAQTFDDFEIVICDNNSVDETHAVAHAHHDRRIRYVRTDRSLSMPDNWEFALGHARGEYVTYLSDDDAIHPRLLASLDQLIRDGRPEPIVWGCCRYYHPSHDGVERNSLAYPDSSGTVREMESRSTLRLLYGLREYLSPCPGPKMLNSCCSQEVIQNVVREAGRFFGSTAPDFASCAAMLAVVPRYTYIDEPFWVAGDSPDSIGHSCERRLNHPMGNAFLAEFGDREGWFLHTPLRQTSEINAIADTLLRVQAAVPGRLDAYRIDWARYFGECYIRIERTRRLGDDVSAPLEEFERELARQPAAVRARVRFEAAANALLTRLRGKPVEGMRHPADMLKRGLWAALAATGVVRPHRTKLRVVCGSQAGFENIAECAAQLDTIMGRSSDGSALRGLGELRSGSALHEAPSTKSEQRSSEHEVRAQR